MIQPEENGLNEKWGEIQPVLDEELNQLSEKYRSAVILCYLEGKSSEEAAQQLGLTDAVVRKRLERARDILKKRLGRRGVSISSSALLGTLLLQNASATVPESLIELTVKAATDFVTTSAAMGTVSATGGIVSAKVISLTESVIRTMFLEKVRAMAITTLAVAGITISGIWMMNQFTVIGQTPSVVQPTMLSSSKATPPVNQPQPNQERNHDELNRALGEAVKAGNTSLVKTLLEQGADPNYEYAAGSTPTVLSILMLACFNGNAEIVQALLDKGADVNPRDGKGNSPLKIAVSSRKTEIVKRLLAKGADIRPFYNNYSTTMEMLKLFRKSGETELLEALKKAGLKEAGE